MKSNAKLVFGLFFFVSLFSLLSCQAWLSWWNTINFTGEFLSGTNSGTVLGYLNSKNGTIELARKLVNLPEFAPAAPLLNWWIWHNDQCLLCLEVLNPNRWGYLISQVSDWYAIETLKLFRSMEARLLLAGPAYCTRSYDRCFLVPNGPVSDKLCTLAYCFFNPDQPCVSKGLAAQCQSRQWMKDNRITCPLPCRILKKRDSLVNLILMRTTTSSDRSVKVRALERLGRSSAEVAKKAGSIQLTTIGKKRQWCPFGVQCTNCPTNRLSGGCMDQSPVTGDFLCCDCFVHPMDFNF